VPSSKFSCHVSGHDRLVRRQVWATFIPFFCATVIVDLVQVPFHAYKALRAAGKYAIPVTLQQSAERPVKELVKSENSTNASDCRTAPNGAKSSMNVLF
jgi:hypothetical protein